MSVENALVATELRVVDARTGATRLQETSAKSRSISDLAWERDSQSVVVVEASERFSVSPLGILAAIAGHPIPHSAFYSARLTVSSEKFVEAELPLVGDIRYGNARICRRVEAN
jgi:hypothetical protein